MAAKSMTVAGEAASVLARLRDFASQHGAGVDEAPLQNGTRVRIAAPARAGLNVYPSRGGGCKIVFDQPEAPIADEIAAALGASPSTIATRKDSGGRLEPAVPGAACWVGSDESGKGDFFGPLVIAAVAVDTTSWRVLETLGVQDSKRLTDARIAPLAAQIRDAAPHEVITIMPARYNELWRTFGSVNRLLGWAHARAIENVLERAPQATAAVADQFGDESIIRKALFERGRTVTLVQMHRAESDPAVAAASVLARAEFVRRLDGLSRDAGVRLPKGASAAVDTVARALVRSRGADVLSSLAKVHFKNTQRATG
jgi:ribonuclease HIII